MTRSILTLAAPSLAALSLAAAPLSAQGATASFSGTNLKGTIIQGHRGVVVHVEASGLTPGWHAIHFHEKGDCSDAAFKSAGGHVHSGSAAPVHGLLNMASTDSGDLPNIYAGPDGTAKAELFSPFVSILADATLPALLDTDGSAIVVHAHEDNYSSQPIGGAGDRVACAVIR